MVVFCVQQLCVAVQEADEAQQALCMEVAAVAAVAQKATARFRNRVDKVPLPPHRCVTSLSVETRPEHEPCVVHRCTSMYTSPRLHWLSCGRVPHMHKS